MKYRRDIEGLRAIAVVAVLLYHLGVPGFGGGYVGVDVFFVISGYLITSLLIDERHTNGHISIKRFYARRARRLLPISATVIVATAVFGALLMPATRLADLAQDVRYAAFFAANLLFAHRGTSYLTATQAPSALRHYWSLAVEEQFYFVWPALIGLITIGARNIRARTAWAMGVIVVGSFTLSGLLTASSPSWSYYGLHTRAWELGVGALLAAVAADTDRIPRPRRAVIGWLGIAGIVVAIATFGRVTVFPGWVAALPVLATGAVLVAGNRTPNSPSVILRRDAFVYLGTRSYSLYLWHWPILVIAEAHLGHPLTGPQKLAAVALTFLLAEVGYRYIEDPIRSSRPLATQPNRAIAMGGVLVAISLTAGVAVAAYHPDLTTGVEAATPTLATAAPATDPAATDVPTTDPAGVVPDTAAAETTAVATSVATTTAPGGLAPINMTGTPEVQAIVDALATNVLPDNLHPALLSAKNDTGFIYNDGCHQYYKSTVKPGCIFGDTKAKITVAVWGDSHAAQWFTALDAIGKAHHWRVIALTQGGCPYLDLDVVNGVAKTPFRHCGPWRQAVRAYMVQQHVQVVFLSEFYALMDATTHKGFTPAQWQSQLPGLLTSLRADHIEPVVIADVPNPPNVVPDCLAKDRRAISACEAKPNEPTAAAVTDVIRAVTSQAKVSLVEPSKWVCAQGRCPVVVGNILVYRDGDHFTNTFIKWLTPLFEGVVQPFVDKYVTLGK